MVREFDLDAGRLQSALTRRFLTPALAPLEATFLALRADADRVLKGEADGRLRRESLPPRLSFLAPPYWRGG